MAHLRPDAAPRERPGPRRILGSLCAVAALYTLVPAPALAAESASILVERQEYVAEGAVDPYSVPNPDPTTLHVGVRGGSELARSFVRLALDRLPEKAQVGTVALTLHVTQPAEASKNSVFQTYNVNPDAWALRVCPLKAELPHSFDRTAPPDYDCAAASVAGVRGQGDAWSFDLTPLVSVWAKIGNTGAAILPALPSGPGADSWAVSFFKARSESLVGYLIPPPATVNKPTKPARSGPTYFPIPPAVRPPVAQPPAVVASPPVAQPPGSGVVASPPLQQTAPSRTWPWVLGATLAAAAAALARVRRPAVAGGGALPSLVADVRSRPRSYAFSSVVAIWGAMFALYSVVNPPAQLATAGPGNSVALPGDGGSPAAGSPGTPGVSPTGPGQPGTTPGVPGGSGRGGASGGVAAGPGTWRTIGNMRVFFPASGGAPIADLYRGAEDIVGLDFQRKVVKLCSHAAMTYGPAFRVTEEDLLAYWNWINRNGGIGGWKFEMRFVDDGYDPGKAVQAAQRCKDDRAFMTLGGIGFDQIPAVRHWAEQNRQLYVHHIVTEAGSRGLRYSFTALPSEERMGEMFGHLAVNKFRGKRMGIIWRDSPNWQSGHDLFKKVVRACGCIELRDEWDLKVAKDQGNYTSEIARLNGQVDAVFVWENALVTVEVIKQAHGQQFYPDFLVFPFNIELDGLGADALRQKIYGIAAWDAYLHGYYEGKIAEYRNEIDAFERVYRALGREESLRGLGADLLFLAWEGYDGLADLFRACLPDCSRNKMAGLLLTYRKKLGGYCRVDFLRGDRHHGGWAVNVFEVVDRGGRVPVWSPTQRCVEEL